MIVFQKTSRQECRCKVNDSFGNNHCWYEFRCFCDQKNKSKIRQFESKVFYVTFLDIVKMWHLLCFNVLPSQQDTRISYNCLNEIDLTNNLTTGHEDSFYLMDYLLSNTKGGSGWVWDYSVTQVFHRWVVGRNPKNMVFSFT